MRKSLIYTLILVFLAVVSSSCGLAQGIGQTAQRTLQSVGRTIF